MTEGMGWLIRDGAFDPGRIEMNGAKFLIANGYMGYRGTLEEYGRGQLVACTLAGLYDQAGAAWREPVNAPNGLLTRVYCGGEELSVLSADIAGHEQALDLRSALHVRKSVFRPAGCAVTVVAERFASLSEVHLLVMKYSLRCAGPAEIMIETGIDGEIWDLNGPHLIERGWRIDPDSLFLFTGRTPEKGYLVALAEATDLRFGAVEIESKPLALLRRIRFQAEAGREYAFIKYVAVYTSLDGRAAPDEAALALCRQAAARGYGRLLAEHRKAWRARWERADVVIAGDAAAQLALRYSIYHLLAAAPSHTDKASIPARGLSGQVYKGAVFWDADLFMLPFFCHTHPDLARNLVRYRCLTLDGARRKAVEYGHRGAFYAWESQETGDDACTLFNVTDVLTGRPIRTYFRDRQVHISADIAYAIWRYYELTGDLDLLLSGGAEAILECARFFLSYAYFSVEKRRYEILDVTGPDEYHERVHNDAFTNRMVRHTMEVALKVLAELWEKQGDFCEALLDRLNYRPDLPRIEAMRARLYIPGPDPETGVIEQFDGYHKLERISLPELMSRMKDPREYLGGGNGLATTTQIVKQADVLARLAFFGGDDYPREVLRANLEHYEPRTEHGSSLSRCLHALVAAEAGAIERGYDHFLRTAAIDLEGGGKQYVGPLYIGGAHLAAAGGAWMAAVMGFGGLRAGAGGVAIAPRLPRKWRSLRYRFVWRGNLYTVEASRAAIAVQADAKNPGGAMFTIQGRTYACPAGQRIVERLRD